MRLTPGVFSILIAIFFSGCSGINLAQMQPNGFPASSQCTTTAARDAASQTNLRAQPSPDHETEIAFVLPRSANFASTRDVHLNQRQTEFQRFASSTETILNTNLPPTLSTDDVVDAIRRVMVQTSARAQIALAKASGTRVANTQENEVDSYPVPTTLRNSQLKDFATKLFRTALRPTINASGNRDATVTGGSIGTYFTAYYEGKFVDRLGQSIQKPQLSLTIPIALTIPDAEIAAAETVLVEYIADLIDPTPVLGDATTEADINKTTKFFPAGNTNIPTAYTARLAKYAYIPASGCGLTQQNAVILADLTNGAADSASTVGGLVTQSFGGLSIGLGVLGKISIGDNQTLGTIVKTAASRLAGRVTLAFSYWAITTVTDARNRSTNSILVFPR